MLCCCWRQRVPPLARFDVCEPAALPPPGERVAVVGGRGFLGTYILRALAAAGHANVTVVDVSLPPPHARDPAVRYVAADVRSQAQMERALAGASSVLHVASIIPSVSVSPIFMRSVNVDGVANVVAACRAAGVRRLAYTSSVAVVIPRDARCAVVGADECMPMPREHVDLYTETKEAAEALVLAADAGSIDDKVEQLRTCVLRPGGIFGLGDRQLVDGFVRGRDLFIIGAGDARIDMVDADSVAQGHVAALGHLGEGTDGAANGQIFNLSSGAPMRYGAFNGEGSTFGDDARRSHWGHPHPAHVPVALILALAALNELCALLFGAHPLPASMSRMAVLYTQREWTFSCSKAEAAIGFRHVLGAPHEAIAHYVDEYRRGQPGLDRRSPPVSAHPALRAEVPSAAPGSTADASAAAAPRRRKRPTSRGEEAAPAALLSRRSRSRSESRSRGSWSSSSSSKSRA